jgi:excisionase family DNA binding protein
MRRQPDTQIFTIHEVANYLKLPVPTAYRLVEGRRLPGHKVGRQWRFHKGAVDEWFRDRAAIRQTTTLVVDDDATVREFFASALRGEHRAILNAADGEAALVIARRTALDLVLLDLVMPGLNGVETFRQLRALDPTLPVAIVTGYPDAELMAHALAVGPFTVLAKPVDLRALQQVATLILGR